MGKFCEVSTQNKFLKDHFIHVISENINELKQLRSKLFEISPTQSTNHTNSYEVPNVFTKSNRNPKLQQFSKVVDEVIRRSVFGDNENDRNVLSFGYTQPRLNAQHIRGLNLCNSGTNEVEINLRFSPQFRELNFVVGNEVMLFLLSKTIILKRIKRKHSENGSVRYEFVQITGKSIQHVVDKQVKLKRLFILNDVNIHKKKEEKKILNDQNVLNDVENDIIQPHIVQTAISHNEENNHKFLSFFSNDNEKDHGKKIDVRTYKVKKKKKVAPKFVMKNDQINRMKLFYTHGINIVNIFEASHILNKLNPFIIHKSIDNNMMHSLYQYVFDKSSLSWSRITKVSKMDKKFMFVLLELCKNHARLSKQKKVGFLLNYYCGFQTGQDTQFKTQIEDYNVPCEDMDLSQEYSDLIEKFSTHKKVKYFILSVCSKIIPSCFWSNGKDNKWKESRNYILFKKKVENFITLGRFERFYLDDIMKGMKIMDFVWLFKKTDGFTMDIHEKQPKCSRERMMKGEFLLRKFFFFIFNEVIVSILKVNFFITENDKSRSSVFYYRKPIWNQIHKVTIDNFIRTGVSQDLNDKGSNFIRLSTLEAKKIERISPFPYFGKARFLPKHTAIRRIVNLGKRKKINKGGFEYFQSINGMLRDVNSVLRFEKFNRPELLSSSVFHPSEMYKTLLPFLKHFKEVNNRLQKLGKEKKLYMVKIDVKSAYDTISHKKLISIFDQIISFEDYYVNNYVSLKAKMGKLNVQYQKFVSVDNVSLMDILCQEKDETKLEDSFDDDVKEYVSGMDSKNGIFVDQARSKRLTKEEIKKLLIFHITKNVIMIGNNYYLQTRGIPQGSILSPLLCSYFYSFFENEKLSHLSGIADEVKEKFNNQNDDNKDFGLLIRLIDDSFYITTNINDAKEFVFKMHEGFDEYGIAVNIQKTKLNFNYKFTMKSYENTNSFNTMETDYVYEKKNEIFYCGMKFMTDTFEVLSDYTRFHVSGFREKVSIDYKTPGSTISQKIKSSIAFKLCSLLVDNLINSKFTIYLNVYQCLLFCAMKFFILVKYSKFEDRNDSYFNLINDVISFTWIHLLSKNKSIISRGSKVVEMSSDVIVWIGCQAFKRILKQHMKFHNVIEKCEKQLNKRKAKFLDLKKRFGKEEYDVIIKVFQDKYSSDVFKISLN